MIRKNYFTMIRGFKKNYFIKKITENIEAC